MRRVALWVFMFGAFQLAACSDLPSMTFFLGDYDDLETTDNDSDKDLAKTDDDLDLVSDNDAEPDSDLIEIDLEDCTPDCRGLECGPDPICGLSCGRCSGNGVCTPDQRCLCLPDCVNRECGDDGCGGTCGECTNGKSCSAAGHCDCVSDCYNRECGDDGCGGTCGECQDGYGCNDDGQCRCMTKCAGKQCGGDGCGGVCGSCPAGKKCDTTNGQCYDIASACSDDFYVEPGSIWPMEGYCSTRNYRSPFAGPEQEALQKRLYTFDGDMIGTPSISKNGTLFVSAYASQTNTSCIVYAISLSGALVWKLDIPDIINSSPVMLADGNILMQTDNGLVLIDASIGKIIREFPIPGSFGSPVIDKTGRIYSTGNKVWMLNYSWTNSDSLSDLTSKPSDFITMGLDDSYYFLLDGINKLYRGHPKNGLNNYSTGYNHNDIAPSVNSNGLVFLPLQRKKLMVFDPVTESSQTISTTGQIASHIAIAPNGGFVVLEKEDNRSWFLERLDKNMKSICTYDLGWSTIPPQTPIVDANDNVFFIFDKNVIALDSDCVRKWSSPAYGGAPILDNNGNIYYLYSQFELVVMGPAIGCMRDRDCPSNRICSSHSICVPRCEETGCPYEQQTCNTLNGHCEFCIDPCPRGQCCNYNVEFWYCGGCCVPPCQDGYACQGGLCIKTICPDCEPGYICSPETGYVCVYTSDGDFDSESRAASCRPANSDCIEGVTTCCSGTCLMGTCL